MSRPEVPLRRLGADEIREAIDVFWASQDELYIRKGQPLLPRSEPSPMRDLFTQYVSEDPDRCWGSWGLPSEAGARPRLEGFGLAMQRGLSWFLGFLFVHPDAQGRGVGRRLLRACLFADPSGVSDAAPTLRSTCVDSIQPVSAGLYAQYGMAPRLPIFTMLGPTDGAQLGALSGNLTALPMADLVASDGHEQLVRIVEELDLAILGYAHPQEHRHWRQRGREGILYREAAFGRAVGYGYAASSGRLGPVAVLDPGLLPALVGDLLARHRPAGSWQILVPGVADTVLAPLLSAGFRFEGTPALYLSSGPAIDFARYLPGSFGLL